LIQGNLAWTWCRHERRQVHLTTRDGQHTYVSTTPVLPVARSKGGAVLDGRERLARDQTAVKLLIVVTKKAPRLNRLRM